MKLNRARVFGTCDECNKSFGKQPEPIEDKVPRCGSCILHETVLFLDRPRLESKSFSVSVEEVEEQWMLESKRNVKVAEEFP